VHFCEKHEVKKAIYRGISPSMPGLKKTKFSYYFQNMIRKPNDETHA